MCLAWLYVCSIYVLSQMPDFHHLEKVFFLLDTVHGHVKISFQFHKVRAHGTVLMPSMWLISKTVI